MRQMALALVGSCAIGTLLLVPSCGDDGGGAVFTGDVASVTPLSTKANSRGRLFAFDFPRRAFAQASCEAPSGGLLLFCVQSACAVVEDCSFTVVLDVGAGPADLDLVFVDDEDGDGLADPDEDESQVVESLRYCNGDEVEIEDAAVNFTTETTIADVSKRRNGCAATPTATRTVTPGGPTPTVTNTPGGPTPTATDTPGGPTPTATNTAGGPTPTATMCMSSLNPPPSFPIVFFASVGIGWLLIPRRRR